MGDLGSKGEEREMSPKSGSLPPKAGELASLLLHAFLDIYLTLFMYMYSTCAGKILKLLLTLQCVVLELRYLSLHILV